MQFRWQFLLALGIPLLTLIPFSDSSAMQLVENGSFETGDSTSWHVRGHSERPSQTPLRTPS